MKFLTVFVSLVFVSAFSFGQEFKKIDKSPLDVAYFPSNATKRLFVKTEEEKKALEPIARILYSRPQKKGRVIFGNLVSYGEPWRLGANESTEIEFFKSVKFGDKKIKPGRYLIYAIPNEKNWEVVLNSVTDQWGVYVLDHQFDVAKVLVPTEQSKDEIEALSIIMDKKDENSFVIKIGWDSTLVEVPVEY